MKIGSPKATNEIANNTLVHNSKGFASGNCQKYRIIVGMIEINANKTLYFKSVLLVIIIWYQIKISPTGIIA